MSWLSAEIKRVVNKSGGEGTAERWQKEWDENPVASNIREASVPKSGTDKFLKYWEKTGQWYSHHTLGSDYPGKDRRSNTSTDDISEPGTKATLLGRRSSVEQYSTANRRKNLIAMKQQNKGKKHTILTQRKGGR